MSREENREKEEGEKVKTVEIDEKGDTEIRTEEVIEVIDNVKLVQVEKDLELTDDEDEEEDGESSLQNSPQITLEEAPQDAQDYGDGKEDIESEESNEKEKEESEESSENDPKEGSEKENVSNCKAGYNDSAVILKQMLETQRRRLNINVGGRMYQTSAKTLGAHENSILGKMTKFISPMVPYKTELGVPSYFLDRDPDTFKYILEFLRCGKDCVQEFGRWNYMHRH